MITVVKENNKLKCIIKNGDNQKKSNDDKQNEQTNDTKSDKIIIQTAEFESLKVNINELNQFIIQYKLKIEQNTNKKYLSELYELRKQKHLQKKIQDEQNTIVQKEQEIEYWKNQCQMVYTKENMLLQRIVDQKDKEIECLNKIITQSQEKIKQMAEKENQLLQNINKLKFKVEQRDEHIEQLNKQYKELRKQFFQQSQELEKYDKRRARAISLKDSINKPGNTFSNLNPQKINKSIKKGKNKNIQNEDDKQNFNNSEVQSNSYSNSDIQSLSLEKNNNRKNSQKSSDLYDKSDIQKPQDNALASKVTKQQYLQNNKIRSISNTVDINALQQKQNSVQKQYHFYENDVSMNSQIYQRNNRIQISNGENSVKLNSQNKKSNQNENHSIDLKNGYIKKGFQTILRGKYQMNAFTQKNIGIDNSQQKKQIPKQTNINLRPSTALQKYPQQYVYIKSLKQQQQNNNQQKYQDFYQNID
ncbi:hypothetical protein PPERSA_11691 [Pseudocohnilembus persalinus]|uniref:Uncharacterized protein n=1 Tax=Pseudocohnilembus persalinus TaxID=266149 RepID=A0A0V0R0Y2_PSEPJ|nr:hypothetical protein PPERSA_11691 [Pseudocohnilembus persalinus]|eukprot:KRX08214.1 hypothetical protein PPERSA_11691 [Pseudocohnilembus persalinus]